MTDAPPFPDLLDLIDERSAVFRGALAVGDLAARVPGCPDWTLRDLAAHLGGVQRFWAAIVAAGPADGPPQPPIDREPHGDLVEWSAESTRLLLDSLRAAGPDRGCWTWWGDSGRADDLRRGGPPPGAGGGGPRVRRAGDHRQTRADPGRRRGRRHRRVPGGEPGLARRVAAPPVPHRLLRRRGPDVAAGSDPEGARLDPAASGEPVATLHGSASDLVLAIFKRIPLANLEIDGDRAAAQSSWPGASRDRRATGQRLPEAGGRWRCSRPAPGGPTSRQSG